MIKLENILLSIVVSLLGLTACTSEIPDYPIEGKTASFTLVMSTDEAQTKTAAGTEEALVNKVHVAVFDVTDIAAGDTSNAKRIATYGDTFEYGSNTTTIKNIDLVTGSSELKARKYFFYVIANSEGNFSSDADFGTYGKYQQYIENTPPSEFVKVGRKEQALYREQDSLPNIKTIQMDLIQLTARVEFKGIVEADTKAAGLRASDMKFEYVDENWTEEMKALFTKDILENKYGITDITSNSVIFENWMKIAGMYFTVGEGYVDSNRRVVRVKGDPATNSSTDNESMFAIKSISYMEGGFNGNSKITIYDTGNFENTISPLLIQPSIKKDIPFYTYETNGNVKLLITGEWTTAGSADTGMGYLIQEREKMRTWSSVTADSYVRYIPDSEITKASASTSGTIEKKYVLTLPTLLKGNRYEIRGTIIPGAEPEILWVVKTWDGEPVIDIPGFN